MSKEWRERPSSLLGLAGDAYISYCVDEAVYMFGRYVEGEMSRAEEATKNAKQKAAARQRAFQNIMTSVPEEQIENDSTTPAPTPKRFRDPAEVLKRS